MLPIFFQKSQFSFEVLGLPSIGKKLSFHGESFVFEVDRHRFQIKLVSNLAGIGRDLRDWERTIQEKIEASPVEIIEQDNAICIEYPNRRSMDALIGFILDKNGGISQNTAIPGGFYWNPEGYPIALQCSREKSRFTMYTSEGRWFLSFTPIQDDRSMRLKFPEDLEKMKTLCKKNGLEIYPVSYLPNTFETTKFDWDKLVESLLL
jgi:hypothetical protein